MSGPDGTAAGQRANWWARSGLVARIAVSATVVAAGLAILFLVLFLAITGLRERSLQARHSQQVIATANELQTLVIDLETGLRGFVITNDEKNLEPWREAQRRYAAVSVLAGGWPGELADRFAGP